MEKREFKGKVYSGIAQLVKALGNPHRLEIIDLLGQGQRTVEQIARETGMSVANASQHLQTLKASNLVEIKRDGNYIRYRLADDKIYHSWMMLREISLERIAEVEKVVRDFRRQKKSLNAIPIEELLPMIKSQEVLLLDIRPKEEYDSGHLPQALHLPIETLLERLKELPKDKQLVAYCRGPFCVFADEAVEILISKGYKASRLEEGFPDWKLKGLPIEVTL